ncbi:MAG: hypothetical protein J4215_02890 [Candidatus Diapherotrites archaeon]|uniref:Uncharacterized protein n=1 Tax=Candidatus Iainarchaeum sp. TaxID=3101447 RepID=A0A8T4L2L0_9ARCH|nr:hypothetical protein [Candidatus Diapherotrites archaeon]
MNMSQIGAYAFIVGIIIAILAGIVALDANTTQWILWLMVVLGLIIGLLNVTEKETTSFLVAAIALIMTATALSVLAVPIIDRVVGNIAVLAGPAALIVALRAIWNMAKSA